MAPSRTLLAKRMHVRASASDDPLASAYSPWTTDTARAAIRNEALHPLSKTALQAATLAIAFSVFQSGRCLTNGGSVTPALLAAAARAGVMEALVNATSERLARTIKNPDASNPDAIKSNIINTLVKSGIATGINAPVELLLSPERHPAATIALLSAQAFTGYFLINNLNDCTKAMPANHRAAGKTALEGGALAIGTALKIVLNGDRFMPKALAKAFVQRKISVELYKAAIRAAEAAGQGES